MKGFAAAGEIHPAGLPAWCLSAPQDPAAGDHLFIAECGEHGARQKWSAERVQLSNGDAGFIGLAGTGLAVGTDGNLAVLTSGTPASASRTVPALIYVPRQVNGATVWEVQNPLRKYRPMATATRVRGGLHYTVFWNTQSAGTTWAFPEWREVSATEAPPVTKSPPAGSQPPAS